MGKKKKEDTLEDKLLQEAPDPTPAAEMTIPAPDPLSQQVTGAWTQLLAMATAQGASRRDIVLMALTTAHGVLSITGENLWPRGEDLPMDEAHGFGLYQAALHASATALVALTPEQQG